MKKSFLLLPVSIAILTACSSNSPAPIENVDGTLSPGVMQPVDNNSSGTWQPEIQQNTMPSTMGSSVPTGTQTPQPSFQPTYQPVQQPAATQPQPAPAPVQPQTMYCNPFYGFLPPQIRLRLTFHSPDLL